MCPPKTWSARREFSFFSTDGTRAILGILEMAVRRSAIRRIFTLRRTDRLERSGRCRSTPRPCFQDQRCCKRALTHASADAARSNERLEFLGDRVLGLIVAEKLHRALSRTKPKARWRCKFNALVRWRSLRQGGRSGRAVADHLILAQSEAGSGGRAQARRSWRGACEAVIAALYLDGGMDAARAFIERYWADAFADAQRRHARRQDRAAGMGAGRGKATARAGL